MSFPFLGNSLSNFRDFCFQLLVFLVYYIQFVPENIYNLFAWYRESELHPLVKSAIFHYEFEFIHPFADGNGRMGRMWHKLLLGKWKKMFFWLPFEDLIRARQTEYYDALSSVDNLSDSAEFAELMLEVIRDSLAEAETGSYSAD